MSDTQADDFAKLLDSLNDADRELVLASLERVKANRPSVRHINNASEKLLKGLSDFVMGHGTLDDANSTIQDQP